VIWKFHKVWKLLDPDKKKTDLDKTSVVKLRGTIPPGSEKQETRPTQCS